MKNAKIAAVLSLVSLLSPLAAMAQLVNVEKAYVESYAGRTDIPVPLFVVAPPPQGETTGLVELLFVVDQKGKPIDIAIKSSTDQSLVGPARNALSQWKFAPALLNGEPVARKVVLPVRFTTTSVE